MTPGFDYMFINFISSYVVIFIVIVFIFMSFFPRTLVYSLSLIAYVSFIVLWSVICGLLEGLLRLLVVLVYVGAIIIIICYICAVSPNIKYEVSFIGFLSFLFCCLLFFYSILSPSYEFHLTTNNAPTPSFFFTDVGLWILMLLCVFIVLLLILSTYISPISSSLRSISK